VASGFCSQRAGLSAHVAHFLTLVLLKADCWAVYRVQRVTFIFTPSGTVASGRFRTVYAVALQTVHRIRYCTCLDSWRCAIIAVGDGSGFRALTAHECGHVLQHAQGYLPLKMRSALVPVVTFANNLVQWVLLAGVIFINIFPHLIWAGIALFAMSTLFSIVTLPVEVNASARAVGWLQSAGITDSTTKPQAVDALKWAAYTYFIAAIGSVATLIYYISIANRR
jgi:hypothetical protein